MAFPQQQNRTSWDSGVLASGRPLICRSFRRSVYFFNSNTIVSRSFPLSAF
jgi:hypothetical protein